MLNPDEALIDLRKYLKKLKYLIENDADFVLLSNRIMNKKKIDDVLCCVESSFPSEYTNFVKKNGPRRLKSSSYYIQIHETIKNKFFFSSNVYSVNTSGALAAIEGLLKTIEPDLNKILEEQSMS